LSVRYLVMVINSHFFSKMEILLRWVGIYNKIKEDNVKGGVSMSGVIRLTPEELRGVAKQYGNESSNVSELIARLDNMAAHLQDIWEGTSSEAFNQQYVELRPSFEKMATLLSEVSQQLHTSATILEDTDHQIASQIRG